MLLTSWLRTLKSHRKEAMQPRMRYVRNAVSWPVTEGAPAYEGIVEEAWPSARHLEDPMLFYCADGSKQTLRHNMGRMLESVQGFLDLPRIRSATLSESVADSIASSRGGLRFESNGVGPVSALSATAPC